MRIGVRDSVADPFADISAHVEDAERTRTGGKPAGRDKPLVETVKVRVDNRRRFVSPWITAAELRAGRVFPLRRGGKRPAMRCAVLLRFGYGDVSNGKRSKERISDVFLEVAAVVRLGAAPGLNAFQIGSDRDWTLIDSKRPSVAGSVRRYADNSPVRVSGFGFRDGCAEKRIRAKEPVRRRFIEESAENAGCDDEREPRKSG